MHHPTHLSKVEVYPQHSVFTSSERPTFAYRLFYSSVAVQTNCQNLSSHKTNCRFLELSEYRTDETYVPSTRHLLMRRSGFAMRRVS